MFAICGALRGLVPLVQFKKREKHPWRSVTGFKRVTLMKLRLLHSECFSRFLNCTNGTKSRSAPHIGFRKLYFLPYLSWHSNEFRTETFDLEFKC